MKVQLFQQDIVWGDPAANRARISSALDTAPKADLYVFPEMFTTGFATMDGAVVEESDAETLAWMKAEAAKRDAALAGSIALKNGERCVNRLFFVKPDGSVTHYDKRHLFLYGGEGGRFSAGSERVTVSFRGVRFLLAVCYDLRFPVWLRNRGDYDAIILVANWPDARALAWNTLVRARAIENQCYMIAANRVGTDPACVYSGYSAMIDPYGEYVERPEPGKEAFAGGDIDLEFLSRYSQKFPVLQDADAFKII
ncbi:MAG: amidohydrolase [Bacteroidales bacterium]|nr:amidohydrolase [Bacteroidales bacterium]